MIQYLIKISLPLGLIALVIIIIHFGRHSEKKKWNNGICPKCGSQLDLNPWMIDSQGGRGWTCPDYNCNYTAWVSYNIDKKRA